MENKDAFDPTIDNFINITITPQEYKEVKFTITKNKMKKETIEEAAFKYAEANQYDLEYYDEGGCQGIEVKSFAEKLVDFTTKWQKENSHSEEEIKFIERLISFYWVEYNSEHPNNLKELELSKSILEQFKKK